MGRALTRKEPSSLVLIVISRLVSRLRTLTFTLERIAPVLSVTVPLIAPRVCWAKEGREVRRKTPRYTTSEPNHFCISTCPFFSVNQTLKVGRGISQRA